MKYAAPLFMNSAAVPPEAPGGALENEHEMPFATICWVGVQVNTALPLKPICACESESTVKFADAPAFTVALVGFPMMTVPATLNGSTATALLAPS